MKEVCYLCGKADDTTFMESYNIGRERLWVCPECHRMGDKEVWIRIGRRTRHNEDKKK